MLFQRIIKHDNIVDVNTRKDTIRTKNNVNFSLYIKNRIFKIYNYYIKLFLITIRYDDKFVLICQSYQSLMKKLNDIEY